MNLNLRTYASHEQADRNLTLRLENDKYLNNFK
jgi:hypothetical protein